MKKVGILVAVLLALVLVVAALAPFLVDLDQYKERILSEVKPYLPREVDFDHIELTVLSGLGAEVKGLRVGDNPAFSDGDFLRLDDLEIRVGILPLLRKEIKVTKIILKAPVIRLARNAEGAFSFEDLTTVEEKGEEEALPAEAEPPPKGLGLLGGLLVEDLVVEDGRIEYADPVLFREGGPLTVDDLDLHVKDLSFDRPVSVELAARLMQGAGQNLHLSATAGPVGREPEPAKIPFSVKLRLSALSLEGISSLLKVSLPVRFFGGEAGVDWEVAGSLEGQVRSVSEIALKDLRFRLADDEGPSRGEPLQCSLSHRLLLEPAHGKGTLESLELSINGNRLRAEGTVEGLPDAPEWKGKLWTDGFRPSTLLASLPSWARRIPEGFDLEGPVEIRLRSEGEPEDFHASVGLDLGQAEIHFQDLFVKPAGTRLSLEAEAGKKGERIRVENLRLQLHTLALAASGDVTAGSKVRFALLMETNPVILEGWSSLVPLLAAYDPKGSLLLRSSLRGTPEDASVNVELSSDKIQFQLPPREGAGRGNTTEPGALESLRVRVQGKRRGEEVSGDAKIEVKKGRVQGIPFSDLLASLRYGEDRLEVKGVELRAFQGTIQGAGDYGLSSGAWRFKPRIQDLSIGEALAAFSDYGGLFSGTFRGVFDASGRVREGAPGKLQVRGTFRVSRGEIKNFNLVGLVLHKLFDVKGVSAFLGTSRGKIREHESTRFDWLEGRFDLRNDLLLVQGMQLHNLATSDSTDSDALLEGKIALDTQLLDLRGKLILSRRHSRELAAKAEVLEALLNEDQRMVLPLTVKGSVQKPIPFLDTKYVLGAISRYYTRKGVEKGVEKLRKQLGLPAERRKETDGEKPAERLLRELFRKR